MDTIKSNLYALSPCFYSHIASFLDFIFVGVAGLCSCSSLRHIYSSVCIPPVPFFFYLCVSEYFCSDCNPSFLCLSFRWVLLCNSVVLPPLFVKVYSPQCVFQCTRWWCIIVCPLNVLSEWNAVSITTTRDQGSLFHPTHRRGVTLVDFLDRLVLPSHAWKMKTIHTHSFTAKQAKPWDWHLVAANVSVQKRPR